MRDVLSFSQVTLASECSFDVGVLVDPNPSTFALMIKRTRPSGQDATWPEGLRCREIRRRNLDTLWHCASRIPYPVDSFSRL